MKRLTAAVLLTLGIVASLPGGCNGKRVAHSGENPLYPLRGLHAAVPCEGCHGPGTPQKLPTACIDCHDDDRPEPDHNPGQDCYGCHVEDGWDIVETTTPIPTADTAPPTGPTGFDHSTLPPTQLCWDCHEVDRKDLTHHTDKTDPLLNWDCQGCHTATRWDNAPIEHPVRIPHGGLVGGDAANVDCAPAPQDQWIVGCEGCHPGGDTTTFVCFSCHTDSHGGPGGTWAENQCMGCHIDGEAQACAN